MRNIHLLSLLFFVIAISFSSCELQSYEDFGFPEYDGEFQWAELEKNAEWANRWGHTAVNYDDKIWIFGGYNPGVIRGDTYYEDVWSSSDGESWDLVLEKAPWLGRKGHQVVAFDDGSGEAMFLVGGFIVNEETGYREYGNDVWKSTNGVDWTELKPRTHPPKDTLGDWLPRFNHSVVVANHGGTDYMYILGGAMMRDSTGAQYAMKYMNDVWRSTDGIQWEKLNNNDYGIRSEAGCTVDPSTGRIYLQGGNHGVIFEEADSTIHPLDDWHWLWSSDDGVNWVPETDIETDTLFPGLLWRSDHHLVFYKNSLWGLSGKTTSKVHYGFTKFNEYAIWKRDDNGAFTIDSDGVDIDGRHGYASVIFDDKLFILGGFTSAHGQSNDVWVGEIN